MSNNNIGFGPANRCESKAGAAVGTTTTTSFTANPLTYIINGKYFTKATMTNGATPTTDINTGVAFPAVNPNYGTVLVFGVDGSGNVAVAQGSIEALDVSGNFRKAPSLPPLPDTICPYAYCIVKAGATASAWTCGSSNFAGPPTGVTFAFVDVATLPDRPQVS